MYKTSLNTVITRTRRSTTPTLGKRGNIDLQGKERGAHTLSTGKLDQEPVEVFQRTETPHGGYIVTNLATRFVVQTVPGQIVWVRQHPGPSSTRKAAAVSIQLVEYPVWTASRSKAGHQPSLTPIYKASISKTIKFLRENCPAVPIWITIQSAAAQEFNQSRQVTA